MRRGVWSTALAVAVALLAGPSVTPVTRAAAEVNAADRNGWGAIAEVWDWEAGESTNGWNTWANGTGRVAIYYGQLGLDSGPAAFSKTATGDVISWLGNSGRARGRWEFRIRPREWATATPYRMRLELVPAGTPVNSCGATTVTLAAWTGLKSATRIGVRTGHTRWTRAVNIARSDAQFHAIAVEIKNAAMTWYVDGTAVGRLTAPAAFTTNRLVPRLVLDATPGAQMTHTKLAIDWSRYYTLDRPGRTVTASGLSRSAAISGQC